MSQPGRVRLLRRDEAGTAGSMLATAFDQDPIWAALWPEPKHRARSLAGMFAALVTATRAARGRAATTTPSGGVALWMPPGRDVGAWATIRSGLAMPRVVLGLPASERRVLLSVLTQFDDRRQRLMPEPHWYLQCLGVAPAGQGDGVGSILLSDGLDRADAQGASTYLETETQANVEFYQRRGFAVLERHDLDALGLPVWLMARPAPRLPAGGG